MKLSKKEFYQLHKKLEECKEEFDNPVIQARVPPSITGNGIHLFNDIKVGDPNEELKKFIVIADDYVHIDIQGITDSLPKYPIIQEVAKKTKIASVPLNTCNGSPISSPYTNYTGPFNSKIVPPNHATYAKANIPNTLPKPKMSNPIGNTPTASSNFNFSQQMTAWLQGGWKGTLKAGGLAAVTGFLFGFLELFSKVFRGKHTWIGDWLKTILRGAGLLLTIGFLILVVVGLATGTAVLIPTIIGLIVSIILSFLGFFLGLKLHFGDDKKQPPKKITKTRKFPLKNSTKTPKICPNATNNGSLYVGKCYRCIAKPATYGYVHKDENNNNIAHLCLCESCSKNIDLRNENKCLCGCDIIQINNENTFISINIVNALPCNCCIDIGNCITCNMLFNRKTTVDAFIKNKTNNSDAQLIYCFKHAECTCKENDNIMYGKLVCGIEYGIDNEEDNNIIK